MQNELVKFFSQVFLFKDIPDTEIESLVQDIAPESASYKKSEDIFLPDRFEEKIGFVKTGECRVERVKYDGDTIPLNTLTKYDSFGILTVLSVEEFPTRVKAVRDSEVIFIKKADALKLINSSSTVAMNVIGFLSKKITFLNKKIATFSSDTVEQKLANHIYSRYIKSGSVEIAFNCKRAAETINAGRASVYRALEALSREGVITFESKKIYINDLEGLERISK